ncbi:hypothetical protein [Alistipes putredinis]|uniref:hypothetical protein n=1 Tax=Alistipes putredinis TaxID=28117 RepID=UPI003A83A32C
MTNGGINNVGALRLSMSQGTALTSVRLTDAQIDAVMRCSTLEFAATQTGGGNLVDVQIFYPLTAYVPTATIRDFFAISVMGTAEAPATLFYTIRYDKTTNVFTEIAQLIQQA